MEVCITVLEVVKTSPWAQLGFAALIYLVGYWHGKGMPEFLSSPNRKNDKAGEI